MKVLSFLVVCLFLTACGSKSGKKSKGTGSVIILPTVSINAQLLEDITSFNAVRFRVSGGCSAEGQPVTVSVGGVSPATIPTCLNGLWMTAIDVTGLSETSETVSITADHSSSSGLSAPQVIESVLFYPKISINTRVLEDITASNAANFSLKGHCSEEGQPVTVSVGGVSPATDLNCTNRAWTITIDVTGLNKTSEDILITVDHSSSGGAGYPQVIESVTNHFVCPRNYVGVPSLADYTTHSFCVMKYEAKASGSNNATSQASGTPYVNINRADSITKCMAIGRGHDLITNDEWQSVSRNIELVGDNWDMGVVGNAGGLSQGHSDNNPSSALAASRDDDKGCEGTLQDCNESTWESQRRTHTLSNGEVIWDVAGNAEEWVKDTSQFDYGTTNQIMSAITRLTHPNSGHLSGGTTTTSRVAKDQFGPGGEYSSSVRGLGLGAWASSMNWIVRGGRLDQTDSGVFSITMTTVSTGTSTRSFRCVYHPSSD